MKVKFKEVIDREYDIQKIKLRIPVRDKDMPYDFPFRENDMWDVCINIETGIIDNWTQGVSHELYLKVCDMGDYHLIDDSGTIVSSIDQNYVPNGIIPGEYGDYIDLKIDKNGKILNWKSNLDFSDFFDNDEDDY